MLRQIFRADQLVFVSLFFCSGPCTARWLDCKCTVCGDDVTSCGTDGVCLSSVRQDINSTVTGRNFRCVDKVELDPPEKPLVCTPPEDDPFYNVECCDHMSFCNEVHPVMTKTPITMTPNQDPIQIWPVVTAVIMLLVLVIAVGGLGCRMYAKWKLSRNERMLDCYHGDNYHDDIEYAETGYPVEEKMTGDDMITLSMSGSGSGLPVLAVRTIAHQIRTQEVIGKGRYGEVRRGRWRGENVAVKIFASREEQSWSREKEIYETCMLRHENLLGYIAADNKDNGMNTLLWLVTDFHAKGSLFDYLNCNLLTPAELLRLCLTTVRGLAHLHMEIKGTRGKPAIAHRDLKSKNILVKENGTACIADLGLAVKHNVDTDSVDIAPNTRVGTKRYMAPEVLDDIINIHHFVSFKRADMYALGLVLWEMAQRTQVESIQATAYRLPYHNNVLPDPSIEEMRLVVCKERIRPVCPQHWKQNEILRRLETVMQECWHFHPAARQKAPCVKKTLTKLSEDTKITV